MSLERRSAIAQASKQKVARSAKSRDQQTSRDLSTGSGNTSSEKGDGSGGRGSAWGSPMDVLKLEAEKRAALGGNSPPSRDVDMAVDSCNQQLPQVPSLNLLSTTRGGKPPSQTASTSHTHAAAAGAAASAATPVTGLGSRASSGLGLLPRAPSLQLDLDAGKGPKGEAACLDLRSSLPAGVSGGSGLFPSLLRQAPQTLHLEPLPGPVLEQLWLGSGGGGGGGMRESPRSLRSLGGLNLAAGGGAAATGALPSAAAASAAPYPDYRLLAATRTPLFSAATTSVLSSLTSGLPGIQDPGLEMQLQDILASVRLEDQSWFGGGAAEGGAGSTAGEQLGLVGVRGMAAGGSAGSGPGNRCLLGARGAAGLGTAGAVAAAAAAAVGAVPWGAAVKEEVPAAPMMGLGPAAGESRLRAGGLDLGLGPPAGGVGFPRDGLGQALRVQMADGQQVSVMPSRGAAMGTAGSGAGSMGVGAGSMGVGGGGAAAAGSKSCLATCLQYLQGGTQGAAQQLQPQPPESLPGAEGRCSMLWAGQSVEHKGLHSYRLGEPDPLVRMSIKLTNRAPDELDPTTLASLRKMLSVYDKLQSMQGYIRPGCTQLIIDAHQAFNSAVGGAAHAGGGGGGGSGSGSGSGGSGSGGDGDVNSACSGVVEDGGDRSGAASEQGNGPGRRGAGARASARQVLQQPEVLQALRQVATVNQTALTVQLENVALSMDEFGTPAAPVLLPGLPTIVAASCAAVSADSVGAEVTLYGLNLDVPGATFWARAHGVCYQLQTRPVGNGGVCARLPMLVHCGLALLEVSCDTALGPAYPLLVLPSTAAVEEVHGLAASMAPPSLRRFLTDLGSVLGLTALLCQPLGGVVPVRSSNMPLAAQRGTAAQGAIWGSNESGPVIVHPELREPPDTLRGGEQGQGESSAAAQKAAAAAAAACGLGGLGTGGNGALGAAGGEGAAGGGGDGGAEPWGLPAGADPLEGLANADDEGVVELVLEKGAVCSLMESSMVLLQTLVERVMRHNLEAVAAALSELHDRFPDRVHAGLVSPPQPGAFGLMHAAARSGDVHVMATLMSLEGLLGEHCSLALRGVNGITPLHLLALLPQAPRLIMSLRRLHSGVEQSLVSARADDGVTPLQLYQLLHVPGSSATAALHAAQTSSALSTSSHGAGGDQATISGISDLSSRSSWQDNSSYNGQDTATTTTTTTAMTCSNTLTGYVHSLVPSSQLSSSPRRASAHRVLLSSGLLAPSSAAMGAESKSLDLGPGSGGRGSGGPGADCTAVPSLPSPLAAGGMSPARALGLQSRLSAVPAGDSGSSTLPPVTDAPLAPASAAAVACGAATSAQHQDAGVAAAEVAAGEGPGSAHSGSSSPAANSTSSSCRQLPQQEDGPQASQELGAAATTPPPAPSSAPPLLAGQEAVKAPANIPADMLLAAASHPDRDLEGEEWESMDEASPDCSTQRLGTVMEVPSCWVGAGGEAAAAAAAAAAPASGDVAVEGVQLGPKPRATRLSSSGSCVSGDGGVSSGRIPVLRGGGPVTAAVAAAAAGGGLAAGGPPAGATGPSGAQPDRGPHVAQPPPPLPQHEQPPAAHAEPAAEPRAAETFAAAVTAVVEPQAILQHSVSAAAAAALKPPHSQPSCHTLLKAAPRPRASTQRTTPSEPSSAAAAAAAAAAATAGAAPAKSAVRPELAGGSTYSGPEGSAGSGRADAEGQEASAPLSAPFSAPAAAARGKDPAAWALLTLPTASRLAVTAAVAIALSALVLLLRLQGLTSVAALASLLWAALPSRTLLLALLAVYGVLAARQGYSRGLPDDVLVVSTCLAGLTAVQLAMLLAPTVMATDAMGNLLVSLVAEGQHITLLVLLAQARRQGAAGGAGGGGPAGLLSLDLAVLVLSYTLLGPACYVAAARWPNRLPLRLAWLFSRCHTLLWSWRLVRQQ